LVRSQLNPNLAEYHIPVNADVPALEAILIENTTRT
jgi:xanthine dehydrogenase YagR molybdenum-binding subunit